MSRVAELQNRVDSQEVVVRHLRQQVAEAESRQQQLATLKTREATLETTVEQLTEELKEAKRSHAPVNVVHLKRAPSLRQYFDLPHQKSLIVGQWSISFDKREIQNVNNASCQIDRPSLENELSGLHSGPIC